MKKLFWFVVLVAAIGAAFYFRSGGKYDYKTVEGDPLQTKIYELENGLKVYMSVNKETPRIQTYIAVKVGGKNDPAETTGLAHYFEHLMFKGTEQFGTSDYAAEKPLLDEIEQLFETYRQTTDEAERAAIYHRIDSISYEASKIAIPNEYDKLMSAIGANGTNAYTSQDMTVYVEDIPSNQIDNWARIEADRFMHPVIRGFHTELETIYEEKNMSLTQDSRKVWESLDAALFPHHPYGTQTVLGTQEHLKNPSITNVKNYHKTYYVPNNMAICVSGDFDPDEMVAAIEKYFGAMEPNPNLPKLHFEPEQPITSPVVKEVFGPEREMITLGWRLPGASDPSTEVAEIASSVFYNGMAGLIDLDVVQQQKTLGAYGYASSQPDYGIFMAAGVPKAGQTLDEVRDILLEEVAKLRNGDFDETLIEASVNQVKMQLMQMLERNSSRADMYVQSFINGTDWADVVKMLDRIEQITKADVVAWANEFLGPESFAAIYKRQGTDPDVQKISAPKITPIVTNRDMQSDFLVEIQQTEVKPIEPVFTDFQKEIAVAELQPDVELLYKQNKLNDLTTLLLIFNRGTEEDPALSLAAGYIDYLGTPTMSPEQRAMELYRLGCDVSISSGTQQTAISVRGLSENIGKAVEILYDLLANAEPNDMILEALKADMIKARSDAKKNQSANFSALNNYLQYGPDFIRRTTLDNARLVSLTSEELLGKLRAFIGLGHEVLYYGPQSQADATKMLAESRSIPAEVEPLEQRFPTPLLTEQSKVVLAQYDANQLYYSQYSNRGETFDVANDPEVTLYNEYFGGGMNAIVFQEMREARGLAYSASARLGQPGHISGNYTYSAFIATQNDKMKQAIEAFDEIINNMPESEAAFQLAKESLIARLRTQRTVGIGVLNQYRNLRWLGLDADRSKQVFEKVQSMTLADVKAAQEKWAKDRTYTYGILGNIKDFDMNYLKTLGPVQIVSQEEIFGY